MSPLEASTVPQYQRVTSLAATRSDLARLVWAVVANHVAEAPINASAPPAQEVREWVHGWVYGWVHEWVHGWVYGWVHGCMGARSWCRGVAGACGVRFLLSHWLCVRMGGGPFLEGGVVVGIRRTSMNEKKSILSHERG